MIRHLLITPEPINEPALVAQRTLSNAMGAVVCFTGVVRNSEPCGPIQALDYEVFERMATHQFGLIFDQVSKTWPVASIRLVHRVGVVRVGEASLWVEVIAPHRGEALAACQWIIDEMKRVVPIWKQPLV